VKCAVVGCFVFLVLLGVSLADGCYVPARAVKKIPEIPAQRALISFKDGRETMVISSALNSESQELGWIIPVPCVPDSIEKAGKIFYLAVPKLESGSYYTSHRFGRMSNILNLQYVIASRFEEEPALLNLSKDEMLKGLFTGSADENQDKPPQENFLTGGNLLLEASPGNIMIEKQGGRIVVRIYDNIGSTITNVFSVSGSTAP